MHALARINGETLQFLVLLSLLFTQTPEEKDGFCFSFYNSTHTPFMCTDFDR